MKINFENQTERRPRAFTLIELLVVISIIAVLAAFTFTVMGSVFRLKKISQATAEMQGFESALENYKAKYGVYPPANPNNAALNPLYYELSGVTNLNSVNPSAVANYQTLDAISTILGNNYSGVFNVGGIVNCSHGSGEDAVQARSFLSNLKANQITFSTNSASGDQAFYYLITTVGGPDAGYLQSLASQGFTGNPFRYAYPGTNNPSSYDLWIDLVINGKTNRVSNWSSQTQIIQ